MADLTPQSFRLARGQARVLVVTMDEAPDAGVAGWHMRFRLRKPGGSVLIEKETGDGITTTDATAGVWEVSIAETDTIPADPAAASVKPGLYDWSFWRTDDGSETPIAIGKCNVFSTAETN